MQKSTIVLLLSILIISCGQKTETGKSLKDNSSVKDSLTNQIEQANKEGRIVGFSVAVVDTTGVLYNEAFGFSDSTT